MHNRQVADGIEWGLGGAILNMAQPPVLRAFYSLHKK
jgi:hypothetical protein